MNSLGTKEQKRNRDRLRWEPPPFVPSGGLSIVIDKEACTGCELCVLACPRDCLELDENVKIAYVLRLDACIMCYNCEKVCKRACIHVILDKKKSED